MRHLLHAVPVLFLASCVEPELAGELDQHSTVAPILTPQVSGLTTRLQSIAPINDQVAWVSGSFGAILRTTDGGATWIPRGIPGTETLAFRDIHAVSANIAFVMTNNGGPNARIYKTADGGATWTLQFQSPIADTFYDCFAFWTPNRAIAVPDAENGRFDAIRMTDGHTWDNIGDQFPAGQAGEGLFPTSGNCVTTLGLRRAWAVLGGAAPSRVLATEDGGTSWASYDIPIAGSPSAGGMNVLFRDRRHGIIGGGDVATPTLPQANFARSSDGGKTWALATATPFPGAMYGLSYIPRGGWLGHHDDDGGDCGPGHDHPIIAAGPGGAAWSRDEGETWEALPDTGGNFSVEMASHRRGWLVGAAGKIVRIDF